MDNFQSGKTQAIDLDELGLDVDDLPGRARKVAKKEQEMDSWGDNPWSQPTEEEKKKRRWADDMKWSGDGEDDKGTDTAEKWSDSEKGNDGWNAPKRGAVSSTSDWDDWGGSNGEPKRLDEDDETKEDGGRRRLQAASTYDSADSTSSYGEGRSKRGIEQASDGYGTSGIRERRGDPYANVARNDNASIPEMKPVDEWDMNDVPSSKGGSEEKMVESSQVASSNQGGDDIPGMTRASIILFQLEANPVVYEIKKMSTTIGRGLDNMVVLNDQFASRHHMVIKYVNGLFEAFNLSEDNVACCNKHPFSHIRLMNGDQIELGASRVKFVVGPISDSHMKLKAPKNGCPMHLSDPPAVIRSPKLMRKNLIILAAAVTVILIAVIGALAGMNSARNAKIAEIEAKVQAEKDRIAQEEKEAIEAAEKAKVTLTDGEINVVAGMLEAYRVVAGDNEGSDARVVGDTVKIKVDSEPAGARIYNADGSLRGVTPYEMSEHIVGKRSESWTLRLDGYADEKVDVTLAKSMDPVSVTLNKGGAAPAAAPAPAKQTETKKTETKKTTDKKKTTSTSSGPKRPAPPKRRL